MAALTINLESQLDVRPIYKKETVVIKESMESAPLIKTGDPNIVISSYLEKINLLIIDASKLPVTSKLTMIITKDDGVNPPESQTSEPVGISVLRFSDIDGAKIKTLTFSTDSATEFQFAVQAYSL